MALVSVVFVVSGFGPARFRARSARVSAWPALLMATALLAGCAQLTGGVDAGKKPVPAASATAASSATGAAAARPAPGAASGPAGLPAFANVIKDARRIEGPIVVWQKDDKVWLELKPADFNQPLFLSPKLKTGLGESRFFGGLMADDLVVEFRRIHNLVQLLARNTEYVAAPHTSTGRAVEAAFSPSLLASSPVVSLPHPDRQSVLVEANALFINDMLGIAQGLQRQYRQGYALDGRNSAITEVRATSDLLVLEVLSHYASAAIALPNPGAAPPGAPQPSQPQTVPDPRSLFMTLHYSLARLP